MQSAQAKLPLAEVFGLSVMQLLSILSVASLFGGMLLFSFSFGTLTFKFLNKATARTLIRNTFPYFYLYVIVNSALAAVFCFYVNAIACVLMSLVCATTIPTRQVLMPAINGASDSGDKKKWGRLHGLSVLITLVHIVLSGITLSYLL